ncbi:MAG TPA: glycosyltransferase family 2 protein [Polyangia bacterium]|nr:glycosyltransferase family 2 protein [Polyangia bacterium]
MTRVSIGMPVYNSRPAYFALQLEALLGQEWGDFELIVSDNGSNAESRALYEAAARRDRRIRYLRHDENRGAVFNFNFALAEARGEYFMWAADDDLYDRRFLARTVPLLDAHPHAVIASANMRFIDGAGAELRKAEFSPLTRRRFAPLRLQAMLARHAYMDIYALHRRAALERTRKHRPMFGGDYALVFEMLLQGTIERADEELFASRVHHTATAEYVSWQLVGDGGAQVSSQGLLRQLAREFGTAILRSDRSLPMKALSAAGAAAILLQRGKKW